MTEHICRECTARTGEYMSFQLFEDAGLYEGNPYCCPFCGQCDYIEPFDEFDGVV